MPPARSTTLPGPNCVPVLFHIATVPPVLSVKVASSKAAPPACLLKATVPPLTLRNKPTSLAKPPRTQVPPPALVILWLPPVMPPSTKSSLVNTVTVMPFRVMKPAPKSRFVLPIKVKEPSQLRAGFIKVSATNDPLVLSIEPPLIVSGPVPMQESKPPSPALLMSSTPEFNIIPPLKVLAPSRASVPLPPLANVYPFPPSPIGLATDKQFALTDTMVFPPKVTVPEPLTLVAEP